MSLALSALFSFRRAAGEVMCASQIFMEDPGSSVSHRCSERLGDGFSKCRTYENGATYFPLDDHIRHSLQHAKRYILRQAVPLQRNHRHTKNCMMHQEKK